MSKFKIKLEKPEKLQAVEPGTIDPVHKILAVGKKGEETIDLSAFDEWHECSVQQKRYIVEFSKQRMKKKRAALSAGVSPRSVDTWLYKDENFTSLYNSVIDLHTESIEEMDYVASFDPKNNTSRGRFLDKRSKVYQEKGVTKPDTPQVNNQTNIFAVLNSPDVTDKGLAGVQKMFNDLKGRGELPEGMEVGQDKS